VLHARGHDDDDDDAVDARVPGLADGDDDGAGVGGGGAASVGALRPAPAHVPAAAAAAVPEAAPVRRAAAAPWVLTASQRVIAEQLLAYYDRTAIPAPRQATGPRGPVRREDELAFPSSLSARDRKFASALAQSLLLQYDQIGNGTRVPDSVELSYTRT
jgi:hypothetical protein